jgi:beta-glucosidase
MRKSPWCTAPADSTRPGTRSNGGAGVIEGIPRLGLPDLQLADSAVGVRSAAERGRYATLLPSTIGEAATWDLKMAWAYGDVIGRELRDQQYNVSLGGGVDITREPRNGRNFEYQGEDPVLAGKMVAQFVKGLQSNRVIGDVKHYAFNDQETGRNIGNVLLGASGPPARRICWRSRSPWRKASPAW